MDGKYERYKAYNFLAKLPSGIFGIIKVFGWFLNCSKRSTTSPRVTLWVTGTTQYLPSSLMRGLTPSNSQWISFPSKNIVLLTILYERQQEHQN